MADCNDDFCPDCCHLDYGDFVEHKLNTDVIGMVIGRLGSVLVVRLSPSLDVAEFQECELRLAEDDDGYTPPVGGREPVAANDNVIDFTKARDLRADTPTKGAA